MNGNSHKTSVPQAIERIEYANKTVLKEDEAKEILNFYSNIKLKEGLYNPKHLPFKVLADIQKKHNSVGWISMDHSADNSELEMYGPRSDLLKPFIKTPTYII